MPTILYDLLNPADATRFVRSVPDPASFTLDRFLPNRTVPGIKTRVRSSMRTIIPALFRVYDAETPIIPRQVSVSTTDLTLPPVGGKSVLNEEDALMMDLAGADPVLPALFDDLQNLAVSVKSVLEVARGQLLTNGKMALPIEGGQTMDVDFQVPTANLPTATTLWLTGNAPNAAALPLTDELAWITGLANTPGVGRPARALTSSRVFSALARTPEYRSAYYGGAPPAGQTMLNVDQFNGVRASWGLPPIEVNDVMVNGVRLIPDNRFLLLPAEPLGETQFGPTAEARNLSRGNNPRLVAADGPGLVGVIQEDGDPPRIWTKVAAIAMPVLFDPARLFTAVVA